MEQQDRLPLPGGGRDMSMREMQQQQQQQQQQRGGKPQQQQQQQPPPPPPQQPQKCPRCDSLNTKFCYYNNYSLSQPRYFCKTCRRYWTQGGTLRNVPVGGGCRKGKRLKRSSSSSLSPDNNINLSTSTSTSVSSIAPLRSKPIDSSLPSSITSPLVPIAAGMNMQQPSLYYPGGGFLSSLAAFQSYNQHQQQQQPLSSTGAEFGSSGLSLLQSFNFPFHSQQQQQQQMHQLQQQQQQQNLYLHQSHDLNIGSSSDVIEEKIVPSTSHQEWSQRFNVSSPSNPIHNPESMGGGGGGGYWTNTTMTTTTTSDTSTVGIPLNPTHWTDHLGAYGGPPQPPSSSTPTTSSSPPSFL